MPSPKTTVQIEAPPLWAIEQAKANAEKLEKVLAAITNVATNVADLGDRVIKVEESVKGVTVDVVLLKEARAATSMRVKGISESDLTQESKIADIIVWRSKIDDQLNALAKQGATIEQKTDFQTSILTMASKDPRVIALVLAAIMFLTAWLKSHTVGGL